MPPNVATRKSSGSRSKADPAAVRDASISVRVPGTEYAALTLKVEQMRTTPAQWQREAAISRRLPGPLP